LKSISFFLRLAGLPLCFVFHFRLDNVESGSGWGWSWDPDGLGLRIRMGLDFGSGWMLYKLYRLRL
jgi:hypothetical protein